MNNGALVSVKVKKPLVEVTLPRNVFHGMTARLVVHCTWNWSLVGADQRKVRLVEVTMMLVMAGNGATKTVNVLVALADGTPLSVTRVVNRAARPDGVAFVPVMTPLVLIEALAGGLTRL